jgi:hypothetical protein
MRHKWMSRPAVVGFLALALGPIAHAGDAEEVRAFFDEYVKRSNAFDASVADLYAPAGRISTLRDGSKTMEMTGTQLKELIPRVMPLAKRRGDTNTFDEVKVAPRGDDAYRVTATRTPAIKCVPDPDFHLDVAKVDGTWRIVEEYTETVSLSRCPPSKELADSLNALLRGLKPHLPLDLDADTRLESVEIVGPAIIYHQRLHTITAAEMDMSKVPGMLQQLGMRSACGPPEMKALINAGGTVRYATVDREGTELANVDIAPGLCP